MNKQRIRIIAGVASAIVAIVVVLVVLTQKRPATCDPTLRAKADELHKTGLAITSVTKAEGLVDAALTKADLVDSHFFLFRRYDIKACDEAKGALDQATSAVAEATKNKAALSLVFAGREAVLQAAEKALAEATSWIATGLADQLVDERRAAKERVDAERAQLDRVSGEVKASGYENVENARTGADASALALGELRDRAKAAVLQKCGLKDSGFENAKVVDEWLVLTGPDAAAIATIESDATTANTPKKCTARATHLPKGTERIPTIDDGDALFTWVISGALMTTRIFVAWGPTHAMFELPGEGTRGFFHVPAAQRCKKVECPQPTHGDDRSLSAKCTCTDADGSERIVETRYAFDGHWIRYEP